jgi:hypothetical protein
MNQTEAQLLLPLLDILRDALSCNGCNDWSLPNTPVGRVLWLKINQWSDPQDESEWTLQDMSVRELPIPDFVVLDYLHHCIKEGISIGQ